MAPPNSYEEWSVLWRETKALASIKQSLKYLGVDIPSVPLESVSELLSRVDSKEDVLRLSTELRLAPIFYPKLSWGIYAVYMVRARYRQGYWSSGPRPSQPPAPVKLITDLPFEGQVAEAITFSAKHASWGTKTPTSSVQSTFCENTAQTIKETGESLYPELRFDIVEGFVVLPAVKPPATNQSVS